MLNYAQSIYHFIMCIAVLTCGALLVFIPSTGLYMHAVGTGLMWMVAVAWFMPSQAKQMLDQNHASNIQALQDTVQNGVTKVIQDTVQESMQSSLDSAAKQIIEEVKTGQ